MVKCQCSMGCIHSKMCVYRADMEKLAHDIQGCVESQFITPRFLNELIVSCKEFRKDQGIVREKSFDKGIY